MSSQLGLFDDAPAPALMLPDGLRYAPGFLPPDAEYELVTQVGDLPFRAFEFHGYTGKRRVVSFGWRYDFASSRLQPADPIPAFLLPLRHAAAAFAGLDPTSLEQTLVSEYAPGAGIGWHRDKPLFGDVVGVSLLAPCAFRFRRATDAGWERKTLAAEPRSAYLLTGPARWAWEHSIPPVPALRYSITFRQLRKT